MGRAAFIPAWLCAFVAAGLWIATPARAQFEEPDTVSRLSLGVFANLNFRGERGRLDVESETTISFSNGVSVGGRVDYELSPTFGIAAIGNFARADEKLQRGTTQRFVGTEGFWIIAFSGELLLRVKQNVPGYFVIGGGARRIVSDSKDPGTQFTRTDSFTEPFGLVGAGLEFASTRRRAFRLDFRLYLVSPAEEPNIDTKSLELDFAAGLAFLYRP